MVDTSPPIIVIEPDKDWHYTHGHQLLLALVHELRRRSSGGPVFKLLCKQADEMPVKVARLLEEAGLTLTTKHPPTGSVLTTVRLWSDLLRRTGERSGQHRELNDWLTGRETQSYHFIAPPYDEASAGNRVAAFPLDQALEPWQPASTRPCGQASRWGFAPMAAASRLFPSPASADTAVKRYSEQTWVDWPTPLPSPFRLAAEAIARGPCEWSGENRGPWRIEASKEALAFLRNFDDALANGNALEAIIQLRLHCRIEPGERGLSLHEVGDQGTKRFVCGIPAFDFDCTPEDVALYLVAIGRLPGRLPLSLAAKFSDPKWRWQESLNTWYLAKDPAAAIPELQLRPMLPSGTTVDRDHRLSIQGPGGTHVLPGRWRLRHEPLHEALGSFGADHSRANRRDMELPGLAWFDGVLHHLAPAPLPPGLHLLPRVARLEQLLPNLERALAEPTESAAGAPGTIAEALAAGLREACTPWPDPWHHRSADDEAWSWSPARCRDQLKPVFDLVAQSPLRNVPSNLLATFLYLIADPRTVCLAWPTEVREAWRFKLRTQDHSWILGAVLAPEPSLEAMARSAPLVVLREERAEVVFSVGDVHMRIEEKSNR